MKPVALSETYSNKAAMQPQPTSSMPGAGGEPLHATGRFSLIVATVGRTVELERLLKTIAAQTYRNFEVIIVDQNADQRVAEVLGPFAGQFPIVRMVTQIGLSRARNLGLTRAAGEWIAFPDDDCWYRPDHLAALAELFARHPEWDGIVAHALDEQGRAVLPWKARHGRMTRFTAWLRSPTYAYCLRCGAAARVGKFDEELGPGAATPGLCGEDSDYLLRAVAQGSHIAIEPQLIVFHPSAYGGYQAAAVQKRLRYARADGWRLRYKNPMPAWWTTLFFLVPLLRVVTVTLTFQWRQIPSHWAAFKGRVQGYWGGRA